MGIVPVGQQVDFADGRSVFVGVAPETNKVFIAFVNANAEVTKFALSWEAATALYRLLEVPTQDLSNGAKFRAPARDMVWHHLLENASP